MTEKKAKHMSLAEYAWEYHKKSDLDMATAEKLRDMAWTEVPFSDRKVRTARNRRTRRNRRTPLLLPDDWGRCWDQVINSPVNKATKE